MKNTITTDTRHGHCFVIHMFDYEKSQTKYFGGWYNETENNETEDECQCWENEKWVDSVDEAAQFQTFIEAKVWFNQIQSGFRQNCSITLYGYNPDNRSLDETHWYQLKTFHSFPEEVHC